MCPGCARRCTALQPHGRLPNNKTDSITLAKDVNRPPRKFHQNSNYPFPYEKEFRAVQNAVQHGIITGSKVSQAQYNAIRNTTSCFNEVILPLSHKLLNIAIHQGCFHLFRFQTRRVDCTNRNPVIGKNIVRQGKRHWEQRLARRVTVQKPLEQVASE